VSVHTERDVSARYSDVQSEVARLTTYIRQRSDVTASSASFGQWYDAGIFCPVNCTQTCIPLYHPDFIFHVKSLDFLKE